MTRNYLNILILAFLTAFSINQISAQEQESDVKVVVIEKTIDENGNETVTKVIKEGEDAKEYVKQVDKDIKVKKKAKVKKSKEIIVDSDDEKKVVIIRTDGDNVEKEIQWKSKGDMPEDIEEILEEHNIEIEIDEDDEKNIRVRVMSDGNEEVIFVDEEHISDDGEHEIRIHKSHDNRKAQLGVMIQMPEEGEGIEVIDVFEGSGAEAAGIKSGDIITEVDNEKIKTIEELVDSVKDREPGEEVALVVVRDGVATARKVKLTKFSPKHDKHEEHEVIIIKKEH